MLASIHSFKFATVLLNILVIIMSEHSSSHFSKREFSVGIKKIGMVHVNDLCNACQPVLLVSRVFCQPLKIVRCSFRVIKVLILRIGPVVRYSLHGSALIGTMAWLKPCVTCTTVFGYAKTETLLFCSLLP